ncbi:MAG: hypothetical protein ACRD3C_11645 [Vicinamibacterales bacterium]
MRGREGHDVNPDAGESWEVVRQRLRDKVCERQARLAWFAGQAVHLRSFAATADILRLKDGSPYEARVQ